MTPLPDAVLDALARCAVEATRAAKGWIVVHAGDELQVVAAAGDGAAALMGRPLSADTETVRFVVSSGQTFSFGPHPEHERFPAGLASLIGDEPAAIVCVPCVGANAVVGALELYGAQRPEGFTTDEIELATLLGHVAAVAIRDAHGERHSPSPSELAHELGQLQELDPSRYAHLASAVSALLGHA